VLVKSARAPLAVLPKPVVLFMSASRQRKVLARGKSQPSLQASCARAVGENASQAKLSAIPVRRRPDRKGDRLIEFLMDRVVMFLMFLALVQAECLWCVLLLLRMYSRKFGERLRRMLGKPRMTRISRMDSLAGVRRG